MTWKLETTTTLHFGLGLGRKLKVWLEIVNVWRLATLSAFTASIIYRISRILLFQILLWLLFTCSIKTWTSWTTNKLYTYWLGQQSESIYRRKQYLQGRNIYIYPVNKWKGAGQANNRSRVIHQEVSKYCSMNITIIIFVTSGVKSLHFNQTFTFHQSANLFKQLYHNPHTFIISLLQIPKIGLLLEIIKFLN